MIRTLVRALARAGLSSTLVLVPLAAQGSTGKIQGVVRDSVTGAAIANVTIQVLGSAWHATSDSTGFYFINGVVAGEHDIRATLAGWRGVEVRGFRIRTGHTETLDFDLRSRTPPASPREVIVGAPASPMTRPLPPGVYTDRPMQTVGEGVGTLQGRIRTAEDAPLAGATVRIIGTEFRALTDSTGAFRFERLPAGSYDVRAEAEHYKPVQYEGVRVRSRQTVTQDMRLEHR